jgi:flagellar hook-length control protein FliK
MSQQGRDDTKNSTSCKSENNTQPADNTAVITNSAIAAGTMNSKKLLVETSLIIPQRKLKKLVRILRNSHVNKRSNVFITLNLGDLGEVRLNVRLDKNKLFVDARVKNQRAGAALAYAVQELKLRLKEINLKLEGFNVQVENGRLYANEQQQYANRATIVAK